MPKLLLATTLSLITLLALTTTNRAEPALPRSISPPPP